MSAAAATDFSAVGLLVGHATDVAGATGCTVILGRDGAMRAGAAIHGRATGTREMHPVLDDHLVDRIDAIVLTGGSAFGLDAAGGVMRWLEQRHRGFSVGVGVVPIVPAAVIFDLLPLGTPEARPDAAMGMAACDAATALVEEGSVGAGTGATLGKALGIDGMMKGGVGCALERGGGLTVGALAVVNAYGDVRDETGAIIAGARSSRRFIDTSAWLQREAPTNPFGPPPVNTTLAVVACSAPIDRGALRQIARSSIAAFSKRITPSGTSVDGDIVFAVSPLSGDRENVSLPQVEALAIAALERAIERAVRTARGRDGVPGLADSIPS